MDVLRDRKIERSRVGVIEIRLVYVVFIKATRTFEAETTEWCHKIFAKATLFVGSNYLGESMIQR